MSDFKYFGLLAFILLIVGLAYVIYKWPQGNHRTFSQHVASHKNGIVYYIALFSIILPILLLFFIGWFIPTFNLPVWFTVFLVVSCVTQYACVFIPEVGGWKTKYHRILSGISGICLIPLLVILLFVPTLTMIDKVIVLCGLMVITGVLYVVMSNKKEQYEPSYIHQSIYYIGFFIPVLMISYT